MKRKLLAVFVSIVMLCTMLPLGAVGVSAGTVCAHVYSSDCDRFCDRCGEARWENFNPNQALPKEYCVLSRVQGIPGDLVQVDIQMAPESIFFSAVWKVSYNTDVLELVACDSQYHSRLEYTRSALDAQPFWIDWQDDHWLKGDIIDLLATLTFRIKENAPHGEYPISTSGSWYSGYHDDMAYLDGAVYVNRHDYDNVCDAVCNTCGEARDDYHVYTDVCDANCDSCDQSRIPPHIYSAACDTTCDQCGYQRQTIPHTYSYPCDVDCNVCQDLRVAEDHVYDYPCDAGCNVCGLSRQPADHVYDDHYDTDCNICGTERTVKVTMGGTGDCTWTRVGTHLTISGNGNMGHYEPAFGIETPWGYQITELVIEEGVTSIGGFAFEGCRNLKSVTLPESVRSIGRFAFYGSGLTSITLPDSLQNIWWGAFSGCKFSSITIPKNVITIDCEAFAYCKSLTSITLPQSITTIEAGAFEECPALTDIYYAGSVASRDNMFGGSIYDTALKNATWHYAAEPISTTVKHSVMDTANGTGLAFRFNLSANGVAVKNGTEADFTNATISYFGEDCKLVGMGAIVTINTIIIDDTQFTHALLDSKKVIDIPAIYLCNLESDACDFAVRIINIPDTELNRTIYTRPYYVVEVDGEQITVYGDINSASCAEYM